MSEKGHPQPLSAEDAAFLHPPPSYEEVMGVYNTSIKQPLDQATEPRDMPQLAYIDIMPRCISTGNIKGKVIPKFDNFSATMEGANRWLQDSPGLIAWKCETIEHKLNQDAAGNLVYSMNEMLRHDSIFGYCVYLLGLRLWLTKNPHPGSPPQQLGILNMVPEKVTIELPMRYGYRRGRMIVAGEETLLMGHAGMMNTFQTFEGLSETIARINEKLKDTPIQGTILSIETAKIKAKEGFKNDLDPEATCWAEDKIHFRQLTQVIRVYYIRGPSAREEIGIEHFPPEVTDVGSVMKPAKFEVFDNVIPRLSQWVSRNQGIRVVNIQQFDGEVYKNHFAGEVEVKCNSTDESASSFGEKFFAKTLRLFYAKGQSRGGPAPPSCITSRLFLPVRLERRCFESMTNTMDRVDAWLRVTDLPIYSVETVHLLFAEGRPSGVDTQRSDYVNSGRSGRHWVTGIRVYFPTPYQEPDPSMLPPVPVYAPVKSSSCVLL